MAEIEFSVLSRSCLKQRLSGEEALRREVDALVTECNTARATINWRFNTRHARTKLHRLYPSDFTVDYCGCSRHSSLGVIRDRIPVFREVDLLDPCPPVELPFHRPADGGFHLVLLIQ